MVKILEDYDTAITLGISVITLMTLVFGIQFFNNIRGWVLMVLKALMYPFQGTNRRLDVLAEQTSSRFDLLAEQHAAMGAVLGKISEQLTPNGGSSLLDSVNRIEKNQGVNAAKLETLLEHSAPMFESDPTGQCVWTSRAYQALTKRPASELMGWGWLISLDPTEVKHIRGAWNASVRDVRKFEEEMTIRPAQGDQFRVLATANPVVVNGKVVSWVGAWEVLKQKPTGRKASGPRKTD